MEKESKESALQKTSTEVMQKRTLSDDEIKRLAQFMVKRERAKSPKVKQDEDGQLALSDGVMGPPALMESVGTVDGLLSNFLLSQAEGSIFYDAYSRADKCNLVLAMLHGIRPRDEVEGMLAVQMVGVHNLAMEFVRRAMLKGQTFDGVNMAVARADKLMRTFTMQLDALNRHRGKGQQKITVKHVHVNEGGQAIVGNVAQTGGGSLGK